MEQNQQNHALSSTQQQWKNLRKQFADTEESIQDQQGIQLMQQWINLKYNNQFQEYGHNESNQQRNSLKQVIRQAIHNQKQTNYIITQKYNLEHAQHLIAKAKEIYQHFKNLNQTYHHKDKSVKNSTARSKSRNGLSKINKRQTGKKLNNEMLLPHIRPNGKVYNPLELSSDFQLLQDTIKQYKPRSPHIFEGEQKVNQQIRSSIFRNRFLKMAFQKFCKQSYNYNGTFSQFSNEDKMNMNKWMVFCKQFDFTEKFPIKDLIALFQTATSFGSTMDLNQFLHAVALLQQKYIERYHTGEKFVQDVLKLNSEASFRFKMQNLKVSYAGPRKNCFEAATYPEPARVQEVHKEKQFQLIKRKKQVVLIQGMYEEHLKDQIKKRKQLRQQKKKGDATFMNHSLITQNELLKSGLQQQRYTSKNPQKLNYSNIFQRNKTNSQQKTAKPVQFSRLNSSSLYKTEGSKKYEKNQDDRAKKNIHSKKDLNKIVKDKSNPEDNLKNSKLDSHRQQNQNHDKTWMTRIRSDSQESDQILKQHLQLQKRIKDSHQSLKVKNLMKEMHVQSARVDAIKQKIEQEEMADTKYGMYKKLVQ